MPKLSIPYRSQWDADAKQNNSDCGPTCLAMILNHFGVAMTPDGVYAHLPPKEPSDFTFFGELADVARAHGLTPQYHNFGNRDAAFAGMRSLIDANQPLIALVKYTPWIAATGNDYQWGHFVVVTGYTDTHVTMHDPLFGLWASRAAGSHFSMPNDLFAAGWGGFPSGENPNWVGLSIRKAGVSAPAPAPQPVPTPPVQPSPPPAPATPAAPASTKAGHRMDDEMRRIEALAAYRWAVAPDPDDEAALAIWREHLGDFGLEYDEYKVQSGDTLAGLAGRFFGEQHRWHAIKAYNRLEREGLWLGETLMIPRLGSSGAHENDALPSDSAEFAKAIAIDDIVDPDLPAQDYNALGAKSIGIGFAE